MAEFGEVGAAFVRISPKLDPGFGTKIKGEVDRALRGVTSNAGGLDGATKGIEGNLSRAAAAAHRTGQSLGEAAGKASGLRVASEHLDKAAGAAGRTRTQIDAGAVASGRLGAGATDFGRRLDGIGRNIKGVNADLDKVEAGLRRGGDAADSMAGKLVKGALAITAAYAGTNFFRGVVNDASDLGESVSKSAVVFKSSAGVISDFSKTSAEAFGISERAALETGATFGNLLTSMGLTRAESANMSKGMLELGADLASFNNLTTDDVLGKIRAGLVGEYEPLRALGVTLNADVIAAKAMELGLASSAKEVSKAAKIQAIYAEILAQTTNAQGDFARTSDGLANTQRVLSASWADAKTEIGTGLLPVALEVSAAFTKMIPVVVDVADSLGGALGRGISSTLPTLQLFGFALGTIAPVLDLIPGPLLSVVTHLVLLEKAFGKFGIDDIVSAPIKRAFGKLRVVAIDSMDGLGASVRRKFAAEVATAGVGDSLLGGQLVASRVNSQALQLGAGAASAFNSSVANVKPAFKFDAGSLAIIERTNQQAAAVGATSAVAATGTRGLTTAVGGLSLAMPLLGVALAAGTVALGSWQQKRSEAAAAQKEWTAQMVSDAKTIREAGGSIQAALSGSTESIVQGTLDRLASRSQLDDLTEIDKKMGDTVNTLGLYTQGIKEAGASGQAQGLGSAAFRRRLIDSGEVSIKVTGQFKKDEEAIREEWIKTGKLRETLRAQGPGGNIADVATANLAGNTGLVSDFNDEIERTAKGTGQARAAAEQMEKTDYGKVAGSMKLLSDNTANSKDAMDDAKKATDDYRDAIENLGRALAAPITAEEDRVIAYEKLGEAVDAAKEKQLSGSDIIAAEDSVAEAIERQVKAHKESGEATAENAAAAGRAAREADTAVLKAQRELVKAQELAAGGGITAERIIAGKDTEAIGLKNQFRNALDVTFAEAKVILASQGGEASAAFLDNAIINLKERRPEFAAVVDNLLAERGLLGKGGAQLQVEVAVEMSKDRLTVETAQFLNNPQLQERLLSITLQSKGNLPSDLEGLIARLDDAEQSKLIIDVVAKLPEDGVFDSALLTGLSDATLKTLTLKMAVEGDPSKLLPKETLEVLLKDKQFASDLVINLKAAGAGFDPTTEFGKVLVAATAGTPLAMVISPELKATANAGQLFDLDAVQEQIDKIQLARSKVQDQLRFDPGFAAAQTGFENTKAAIEAVDLLLADPKIVKYETFGENVMRESLSVFRDLRNEEDITKKINIDVAVNNIIAESRAAFLNQFAPTAAGGLFNRAQVRLIGEAGPEAVIPLSAALHDRAASLLEQAGVFERFSAEFAARFQGSTQPAAPAAASGGRSIVNHIYSNDAEAVARRVNDMLGFDLAGSL